MSNYVDNLDVIDSNNQITNVLLQDRDTLALATKILNSEVLVNAGAHGVVSGDNITTILQTLFQTFKYVFLPTGTYTIDSFEIPEGCGILGNDVTINSSENPVFTMNDDTFLYGLTIVSSTTENYSECITIGEFAKNARIDNCNISGAYITIRIHSSENCVVSNSYVRNSFLNGLCIYADGCKFCVVDNCEMLGNYADGSHIIQFTNGDMNTVRNCELTDAYNFAIAFTNEKRGTIRNNKCFDTRVEAINLDNSDECEVACNSCMWNNPERPSYDHAITLYGSTKSCNLNEVYGNTVDGCYKAGIALAGGAFLNHVHNNILMHTNIGGQESQIKGAITLYRDASNPPTNPSFNMINNNSCYQVPFYVVEELYGYQNVFENNISFPTRATYLTDPIYHICDDACITVVTPEPTITTTGDIVSHEEFWNGEFIEGTFSANITIDEQFTYSIGIQPAPNNLFSAHVNGGADCPIYMDATGTIMVAPTFSGTVQINYRYKAYKYFT